MIFFYLKQRYLKYVQCSDNVILRAVLADGIWRMFTDKQTICCSRLENILRMSQSRLYLRMNAATEKNSLDEIVFLLGTQVCLIQMSGVHIQFRDTPRVCPPTDNNSCPWLHPVFPLRSWTTSNVSTRSYFPDETWRYHWPVSIPFELSKLMILTCGSLFR